MFTNRVRLVVLVVALAVPLALAAPAVGQELPGVGVDYEIITTDVVDPTVVEVTPDGRVIIGERTGLVKIWDQDGTLTEAGRIEVGANSCSDCPEDLPEEGGIHGLLLAQDFDETGHLYVYYSVANTKGVAPVPAKHPDAGGTDAEEGIWRLSRFTLVGDELDLDSEVPLLENPGYWDECCHYAGDMDWLPDGTLVLATGDDVNPHDSSGFAPRDKRDGREAWDADRTSQNPADRRGKILRLHPDGTVPGLVEEGEAPDDVAPNPHIDDPDYDPYVYASGFRNPYRIAVHETSGAVILGNVGPDAFVRDADRGPAGYDEVEVVPPGGGTNHGWPHCIGENEAYVEYDWDTGESGDPLSCEGMTPSEIFYAYKPSVDQPTLAVGLRAMMAGVVYDYDGDGALALPDLYEDQLLLSEWGRQVLYAIGVEEDGGLDDSVLLPVHAGSMRVIDMEVGPDGAVYMAEYGSPGFYNNANSRISRLKCVGCQPDSADYGGAPVAMADLRSSGPASSPDPTGVPVGLLAVGALLLAAGVPLRRRKVV